MRSYEDFQPLFDKKLHRYYLGVLSYRDFQALRSLSANQWRVKKLLAALGWTEPVVIPKGALTVELPFPALGIALTFSTGLRPKIYFCYVTLRPPFAGELPCGLTWNDDRATVESKVGRLREEGAKKRLWCWAPTKTIVAFSRRKGRPLDSIQL